jgi:hypothetical protein
MLKGPKPLSLFSCPRTHPFDDASHLPSRPDADYKREPHSNENITASCEDAHGSHLAPTALGSGNGTSRVEAH